LSRRIEAYVAFDSSIARVEVVITRRFLQVLSKKREIGPEFSRPHPTVKYEKLQLDTTPGAYALVEYYSFAVEVPDKSLQVLIFHCACACIWVSGSN
jgi:hypothetical protein